MMEAGFALAAGQREARLRRALACMWFAYVNKDPDGVPHMFEESAVNAAEQILGPFGSWPELLKDEGGGE
jgi:hypothetical protein